MKAFPYTLSDIVATMERLNYVIFDGPWDINNVWIRTQDLEGGDDNTFNDWGTLFYFSHGVGNLYSWPGTTDPGRKPRLNPSNNLGIATVVPGQYRSCWTLGKHKDQYKAMVQCGEILVYRDNNKDAKLDFVREPKYYRDQGIEPPIFKGYGINGHRESAVRTSTYVDGWSEGCLVNSDEFAYENVFLEINQKQVDYHSNNAAYEKFTLTLLHECEILETLLLRNQSL